MALDIRSKKILSSILTGSKMTVIQNEKVSTAFINLETKVITLPKWDYLENDSVNFLIAHECSHAIHTPNKMWMDAIKKKDEKDQMLFKHIMNVVEDYRIDVLINKKYPGTKRWYYQGLKQLVKKDFFKLSKTFLQRLNKFLKCERFFDSEVDFSSTEEFYRDKCMQCETFQDVLDVSEEIFKYVKSLPKDDDESYKHGEGEIEGMGDNPISNPDIFDIPVEDLEVSAPDTNSFFNITVNDTIYDIREKLYTKNIFRDPDKAINLNVDNAFVNHLFNTFEKEKAIKRYSMKSFNKSGNVDAKRLFQYKTHDNVFERKAVSKVKDKDHYVCLLIDMSSSMINIFPGIVETLLELCIFMSKIKIKFHVYGFTTSSFYDVTSSEKDFRSDIDDLANSNYFRGTPLLAAINTCIPILENRTEQKKTFILLSDGGSSESNTHRYIRDPETNLIFEQEKFVNGSYEVHIPALKHLKYRTECNIIHFFIGKHDLFKEDVYGADLFFILDENNIQKDKEIATKMIKVINNENDRNGKL